MNTASEPRPGGDTDRLLTTEEVADFLKVKPETLATWRWKRRGPAYTHVGRQVRYSEADVRAYIQSRRTTP